MHTPPNAAHLISSALTLKVKLVLGKQTGTSPCQAAAAAPLPLSTRGEFLLLREQTQHVIPDHCLDFPLQLGKPHTFQKTGKGSPEMSVSTADNTETPKKNP